MPNFTVSELIEKAISDPYKIFNALGIKDLTKQGNEYRGSCPIHNGDNETAFCYYTGGNWACFTRGCHQNNSSILGLIAKKRGLGWEDAREFLGQIFGGSVVEDIEGPEIRKLVNRYRKTLGKTDKKCSTEMEPIPIEKYACEKDTYFRSQGFTEEIIAKFKIGYCSNPYKPMAFRSFAPILSHDGKYIIGVTGRTVFEKCSLCLSYHDKNNGCESDGNRVHNMKWKHYGFKSSDCLYNIQNLSGSYAVICEGPKDVWWLDQLGIKNSLCIFGTNLQTSQVKILIKSGVVTLYLCLDNDEAGNNETNRILKNYRSYFNIIDLSYIIDKGKDISDISKEKTIDIFKIIKDQS